MEDACVHGHDVILAHEEAVLALLRAAQHANERIALDSALALAELASTYHGAWAIRHEPGSAKVLVACMGSSDGVAQAASKALNLVLEHFDRNDDEQGTFMADLAAAMLEVAQRDAQRGSVETLTCNLQEAIISTAQHVTGRR